MGYELQKENRRTCIAINSPDAKETASLLFANAVDVRHVHLDGSATHNEVVKTRETLALDFLHRNRTVCWISHNNRHVYFPKQKKNYNYETT